MRGRVILSLLLAVLGSGLAAGAVSFDLVDASGHRHALTEAHSSKAVVLLFLGTDCPLSNSYIPELRRIFTEYSPRGVAFYAVHSDPAVRVEEVRQHARDFHYPFPALLDTMQSLARQVGATTTPEAAVLSPAGDLLYRGRIDDRFVAFGKERPQPARRELRVALDEILAGKPVPQRFTKSLGCAIPFPHGAALAPVTFTRDIAPILYKHCLQCHRSGEIAPFPLLTYQDAARRASLIASVTASRYMPPWKPVRGYGKFQGERRLTSAQIAELAAWAKAGAPEGDPAALPAAPKFPEGWQLGKPDRIVKMFEPFPVPADGPDIYQCFVIPLNLAQDKYVRAVEFQPGDRRVVHHALFFLDSSREASRRDAAEPGPGYRCFGVPGFLPSGSLGGWSPGAGPILFPDVAPTPLPKNADIVVQIHFHPTGKPESAQSSLGLYFADKPPQKRLADVALGSRNIDIPPGDRNYKVTDHFTVPIDVEAVGIIPHAHFICRDMKGLARLPDGTTKWLIWIRDWDFNWQMQYHYAQPIHLPAGTRLEMEFTYDNSEQNPRNPNHPPKRVVWGPGSTDEMAGLHIEVIPDRMDEMSILGQALWGKIMRSVGGKFYQLPAQDGR